MKLVNILLGTVFLIIVFNVLLPKKSMLDSFISGNDGVLTNEDKDEIIKNRGKVDSESFPIPRIYITYGETISWNYFLM